MCSSDLCVIGHCRYMSPKTCPTPRIPQDQRNPREIESRLATGEIRRVRRSTYIPAIPSDPNNPTPTADPSAAADPATDGDPGATAPTTPKSGLAKTGAGLNAAIVAAGLLAAGGVLLAYRRRA